jgi:hypothetical protein
VSVHLKERLKNNIKFLISFQDFRLKPTLNQKINVAEAKDKFDTKMTISFDMCRRKSMLYISMMNNQYPSNNVDFKINC